jgi:thiamine monophosphate synthase
VLLAITPGDGRPLARWIDALAAAGLRAVLVREVGLGRDALAEIAGFAASRVEEVVLHHRNPHARAVATELGLAVHPPRASAHTEVELDRAFAEGVRWALLSPVYRPTSKPDDGREPLGIDRFLEIAAGRAVLALGGVTPERHGRLVAAGAFGSAVLGGLFGEPDPRGAAEAFRRYVGSGGGTGSGG